MRRQGQRKRAVKKQITRKRMCLRSSGELWEAAEGCSLTTQGENKMDD